MTQGVEADAIQLARLTERIGALTDKVEALHSRHDKLEVEVRDELRAVRAELRPLLNFHQRTIGAKALLFAIATVFGGMIVWVFNKLVPVS